MKRIASVIGIEDENIERYEQLHAEVWPLVLERLKSSNIRNYSIFRYKNILFSYLEYAGDDLERDMKDISDDLTTQEWWKLCIPLQTPFSERKVGEWWMEIEEVFHLD